MQIKKEFYQIRNYHTSDREGYIPLYSEAVAEGKEEYLGLSPKQLQLLLECHDYSLNQNLFICEKNREIIGCLYATPERGIDRIIFYGYVHPAHRRKNIGSSLFTHGFKRARAIELSKVHVNIDKDNKIGKLFLIQLGFNCIRKYLGLYKSLLEYQEEVAELPSGFKIRCLQNGEEEMLAQLQNNAFQGSWGFNPNTGKEIIYRLHSNGGSPEDIILVLCGEKPAGYLWTQINVKKGVGRIYMMGVEPEYRGKKIGKILLAKGLSYLAKEGMHTAILTVDDHNKTAKNLYQNFGFKLLNTSLWYEKWVD
jgi:mycothiol synthase